MPLHQPHKRGGGFDDNLDENVYDDDTTSYVKVDEIWNEEKEYFDASNLGTLLKYVTGDESAGANSDTLTAIENLGTQTSAQIRSRAVGGKTSSQDIIVRFGGLDWTVTYLSKDKDGNSILTLWLSSSKQDAFSGRSSTEGSYYGYLNGSLYSDWSADWSNSTPNSYPSNMYGTSYIRAITLNNGGRYATSDSTLPTTEHAQNSNSAFAIFTMENVAGSVTDYIVKPNKVAWQETESIVEQFGSSWSGGYVFPNEAYGTPSSGGWYSSTYNYSNKTNYTEWANDYIWLPSLTETGYSSSKVGIWDTSTEQRRNISSSTSSITPGVGSSNSSYGTYVYNYSWLRSGNYSNAYAAYRLNPSGASLSYRNVNYSNAVRPALHLNLSKAVKTFPPDTDLLWTDEGVVRDTDFEGNGTESDPYLISSAEELAGLTYEVNKNGNAFAGKYFKQTADIDLSRYLWDPIGGETGKAFSGNYDGMNHSIFNAFIEFNENRMMSSLGFFSVASGVIKNLEINNNRLEIELSRSGFSVGGIVGSLSGTMQNCSYKGQIVVSGGSTSMTNAYSVGGLVGSLRGTILECYNMGNVSFYGEISVSGSSFNVGGLTGEVLSSGVIKNSYNAGNIKGGGNSDGFYRPSCNGYTGGISGNCAGEISNCYNLGLVSGSVSSPPATLDFRYAGISVGGKLINCFNLGEVRKPTSTVFGHTMTAIAISTGTMTNCYYGGDCGVEISGETNYLSDITTLAKTEDWYKDSSYWNSSYPWDFDYVWYIDQNENEGYPSLYKFNFPNTNLLWTDEGVVRDTDFEGNGTESDPYLISSAEELAGLAYEVNKNGNAFAGKYFKQTADIDLSAYWWDAIGIPSGDEYISFSGNYDGGGYTVSGIFTKAGTTDEYNYQGLFGVVIGSAQNRSVIKNVTVNDSVIQGNNIVSAVVAYCVNTEIRNCVNNGKVDGSWYISGISASVEENVLIDNCLNYGYISGTTVIGGIVGEFTKFQNSEISNCKNYGKINGYRDVGGVVGQFYRGGIMKNCENYADIIGTEVVGGIIGRSRLNFQILNCKNYGNVIGDDYVAGISGVLGEEYAELIDNEIALISHCENHGEVVSNNETSCGGIVASSYISAEIKNSANFGSVEGGTGTSGILGSSNKMTEISHCYNVGDINGNDCIGGILGTANIGGIKIADCYNTGNISSLKDNVGGIAGHLNSSESSVIQNCYNTATISSKEGHNAGGILGTSITNDIIVNCYNTGSVSVGRNLAGGIVGVLCGSVINCYWGGNCTLSSAYGSLSSAYSEYTGTVTNSSRLSNDNDPKTESWYTTSSNWDSSYPWDFDLVWALVEGENDGYPVFKKITVTYHSNYGSDEVVTRDYYASSVYLEDDIFERPGYVFFCWNTSSDRIGTTYEIDKEYQILNDIDLYAVWIPEIYAIRLVHENGTGDSFIYQKYGTGFYSNSLGTIEISSVTVPTGSRGYHFAGYYTERNGAGVKVIDENGNIIMPNDLFIEDGTVYAYWEPNVPAYWDEDGQYWYIEYGKMPQSKVTDTEILNALNNNIGVSVSENGYYFAGQMYLAKVYNGEEYVEFRNSWYKVEPIRWRLDTTLSSSASGYQTADTIAVMENVVYAGKYSDSSLNLNDGYVSVNEEFSYVQYFFKNFSLKEQDYLLNFSAETEKYTSSGIMLENSSSSIFLSSEDEILNVFGDTETTFSSFTKDYLDAMGNGKYYFTRDLGTNLNSIKTFTENGGVLNKKPTDILGMRFTIKVDEFVCL